MRKENAGRNLPQLRISHYTDALSLTSRRLYDRQIPVMVIVTGICLFG